MKQKKVPYNLRLPESLKKKLEKEAREQKRSLNQQLVMMLELSLNSFDNATGRREIASQ